MSRHRTTDLLCKANRISPKHRAGDQAQGCSTGVFTGLGAARVSQHFAPSGFGEPNASVMDVGYAQHTATASRYGRTMLQGWPWLHAKLEMNYSSKIHPFIFFFNMFLKRVYFHSFNERVSCPESDIPSLALIGHWKRLLLSPRSLKTVLRHRSSSLHVRTKQSASLLSSKNTCD